MSTLENLKKEAKRWLKALRAGDPSARERLDAAWPGAPQPPGLRDIQHALARESGHENWVALKAALELEATSPASATPTPADLDEVATRFLSFACWDHHVRGRGDSVMREAAATRLLAKHPDIARHNVYTAIVCGEVDEVRRVLDARPDLINEKGGSRSWEPILYLCYARVPIAAAHDNALAIATLLLDRGANPNASYPAGDSAYTALVGVAGEGEQDAAPHPQREALYQLLLEHGAGPYDIQVLYNTHFHGDVRWWLELTYARAVALGRQSDWDNDDWPMLDMGGYGAGAGFLLWVAIDKSKDAGLAEWLLAHGANPNAAPARDPRFSKRSLHQTAILAGRLDIAEALVRYGADVLPIVLHDTEAFVAASARLDRAEAQALIDRQPEFLHSTPAMFAAAKQDRPDVIDCLLDLGVSIEVADRRGQRTMHVAAESGARRVLTRLIARGAEIDPVESQWGATPIGFASYGNDLATVDVLARVSRAVWTLTYRGKVDRLREVLEHEPTRARELAADGTTLLWRLPDDEDRALEVIRLLVTHGADPSATAKDGSTAADAARGRGLDRAGDLIEFLAAGGPSEPADPVVETEPTREDYERTAEDLVEVYASGGADALRRLAAHYRLPLTVEDVRARVWRRVRTVREAKGAASAFGVAEARTMIAQDAGFGSWDVLVRSCNPGGPLPAGAFTIDPATSTISPHRQLRTSEWDALIGVMKERRIAHFAAGGLLDDRLLARLADLDHVTGVSLDGSRMVTDAGLRELARMPQLERLDISGGNVTNRGLDVLRHLPNLRRFSMYWQKGLSDAGLANLRSSELIEEVDLLGSETGDGVVEALRGKAHLRRLKVGRLFTDRGLSGLRDIPRFRTWHGGNVRYALMGGDRGPAELMLDGPITNAGLSAIAGLDGLSGLEFFWHVPALTSAGLASLSHLPNLSRFGCESSLCDDVAMQYIGAMPNLRKLNAQGTVATDEGFVALARSRTLEYIWGRESAHLGSRGFRALATVPTLRGFALSLAGVDDQALALLPQMRALRHVVPMNVNDDAFRHVGACVGLEELTCMYCRETGDEATAHLIGLPALRTYYAGATRITDRSLESLSRIASLERVEIYECLSVTDAGLPSLARLPKLRNVSLSGLPKVTHEGTAVFSSGVHVDYTP